jgi:hypothetical protein
MIRQRRVAAPIIPRPAVTGAATRIISEPLLVLLASAFTAWLFLIAPTMIVQDSWASFVAGREIVQHGLPHTDPLTVMAGGREWVDQQWLAQLILYGVVGVGGVALVGFCGVLLTAGSFTAAIVWTRRQGVSQRSVFIVGGLCGVSAPWAAQVRAQSLALPLFVACIALLAGDARRPGRRVLWALPLLVVWANLHGSVVLGAGLVAMRGVWIVGQAMRPRLGIGALLALGAPLALLATPYGPVAMVGYYRLLLVDPPFAGWIAEWNPTTLSSNPWFVGLASAAVMLAITSRSLTFFERAIVVALVASGFQAERNTIWLMFAGPMLLSGELDRWLPVRYDVGRDLAARVAALGVAMVALIGAAHLAVSGDAAFGRAVPSGAAAAVDRAAADPSVRVFADDRQADWLLWRVPSLRGRVAYDVRFELLTRSQIRRLAAFHAGNASVRGTLRGYGLLVLDRGQDGEVIDRVLAWPAARVVWHGDGVWVVRLV